MAVWGPLGCCYPPCLGSCAGVIAPFADRMVPRLSVPGPKALFSSLAMAGQEQQMRVMTAFGPVSLGQKRTAKQTLQVKGDASAQELTIGPGGLASSATAAWALQGRGKASLDTFKKEDTAINS